MGRDERLRVVELDGDALVWKEVHIILEAHGHYYIKIQVRNSLFSKMVWLLFDSCLDAIMEVFPIPEAEILLTAHRYG